MKKILLLFFLFFILASNLSADDLINYIKTLNKNSKQYQYSKNSVELLKNYTIADFNIFLKKILEAIIRNNRIVNDFFIVIPVNRELITQKYNLQDANKKKYNLYVDVWERIIDSEIEYMILKVELLDAAKDKKNSSLKNGIYQLKIDDNFSIFNFFETEEYLYFIGALELKKSNKKKYAGAEILNFDNKIINKTDNFLELEFLADLKSENIKNVNLIIYDENIKIFAVAPMIQKEISANLNKEKIFKFQSVYKLPRHQKFYYRLEIIF